MKKRFLALALALGLSLVLSLPALGAEAPPKTYEQAVAELRDGPHYAIEEFFDTALCSVFLYRWVGTPHSAYHELVLVYKAGSPLGDGTTVELPLHPDNEFLGTTFAPDTLELNEDGSGLRYTYYAPELGTDVYSVELATGEVTTSHVPPTYEEIFDAHTLGWNVERRLETPDCTAVLMWSELLGVPETETVRDYALALIFKTDTVPEKQFRRLVLPSTAAVGEEYPQYPTDRAPDELYLNEDGSVLTYVYRFDDALYNAGGELLHDKGTYTYRVDTATGELTVEFEKSGASGGEKPPAEGPENGPSPVAPSLEAERTTFVDISPSDWFAPYVDVCVEAGLMRGVGEGKFDPQGIVTQAEAATIAARIHHIKNGGDGVLPAAPEEWGRMTLTFAGGETYTCYHADYDWEDGWQRGWLLGGRTSSLLYFERPEGWDGRDYQRVTLTMWASDTPLQGVAEVPNNVGTSLRFIPDEFGKMYDALRDAPQTQPSKWYRDTDYYLLSQGLSFSCADNYAHRDALVSALDAVLESGDLPAINHIADYPDATEWDREMVLRLYNAGILTGTDEFGSFSPDGYLTRSEVAAMAARILKPELRLTFTPEEPVYQSYTLTELDFGLGDAPLDAEVLSTELLHYRRQDEEGRETGQSILRSDGTVIDLPAPLNHYPSPDSGQSYPLLVLAREDLTIPGGYAYGVLDPITGEMALPFGPYSGDSAYPGAGDINIVENGRMILTREATWDRETWMPLLLRDDKGQVVCELPEREGIDVSWGWLRDGLAPAYDQASGLWGYVDVKGEWAIPPQFCNYDASFSQERAVVCRINANGEWRYGVIDPQGREVLPCKYDRLEDRGEGLYLIDPFDGVGCWLREDGSTFRNGYLDYRVYLCGGYLAVNQRYLDENFQYATPAAFDWTGPINAQGNGFVRIDGKVYRIQFEK